MKGIYLINDWCRGAYWVDEIRLMTEEEAMAFNQTNNGNAVLSGTDPNCFAIQISEDKIRDLMQHLSGKLTD
jgi:hypothetical protein